jgi:hypothetical protein
VYIVSCVREAAEQRGVAVTPVCVELLTSRQSWLWHFSHCTPNLG